MVVANVLKTGIEPERAKLYSTIALQSLSNKLEDRQVYNISPILNSINFVLEIAL